MIRGRSNHVECYLYKEHGEGHFYLFIFLTCLGSIIKQYTYYVLCHEIGSVTVEQAVGARESVWKSAHLSIPVVDGELGKFVLAKQNIEKGCALQ